MSVEYNCTYCYTGCQGCNSGCQRGYTSITCTSCNTSGCQVTCDTAQTIGCGLKEHVGYPFTFDPCPQTTTKMCPNSGMFSKSTWDQIITYRNRGRDSGLLVKFYDADLAASSTGLSPFTASEFNRVATGITGDDTLHVSQGSKILGSYFTALETAVSNRTRANICLSCNTGCQGCNTQQGSSGTSCTTCVSGCQNCNNGCNATCNIAQYCSYEDGYICNTCDTCEGGQSTKCCGCNDCNISWQ